MSENRVRGLCDRCSKPSFDYDICYACTDEDDLEEKKAYARAKVEEAVRYVEAQHDIADHEAVAYDIVADTLKHVGLSDE